MANFGNELIQTLKQFFPMFSRIHEKKQLNQQNNAAASDEREGNSKDNEKFVTSKMKKNHLLIYFESAPEGANVIQAIKLNRRFIEEACLTLQQAPDDLVWFLINEDGEAQYDEDLDLIIYRQGDGTVLSDEQKNCQKVRLGLLDEKIMIQGANVGNFEWDKTYLFSFGETGELESIRPIGNNFLT